MPEELLRSLGSVVAPSLRRRARSAALGAFAVLASAAFGAPVAFAGDAPPPDPAADAKLAEAKKLYEDGSAAFSRNEFDAAVTSLQRSFDLVPSPTAELMLARALRESGKLAEAASHFASCEAAARTRIANGDERFNATAADAVTEGAALRAKVGALDITVAGAQPGDAVEIEGKSLPVEGGRTPTAFHEPGNVAVTLRPAHGAPVTKTVLFEAGKTATLSLDAAPAPDAGPKTGPTTSGGRKKWAVPAAIAAGGVAAVGAGLFIGFGLKSNSIYDELTPCAGHCSPSVYGDKARSGATAQNVANAGLTIGIVGAAACGTFVVLALTDAPKKPAEAKPVALAVSPFGASLVGAF